MAGLFISFEGGEGVGKSTQIKLLTAWLREQGRDVLVTFEPGDSELGASIRGLVLTPGNHVTPRAEALLYAADRAHHVDTVIEPALARGQVVITDRYVDSTLAYQGAGRALERADVQTINDFAVAGRWPELTVLLDVDPSIGVPRARGGGSGDRIEAESVQFHHEVRDAFLQLAAQSAQRFVVIDGAASVEEVHERILTVVATRLDGPVHR